MKESYGEGLAIHTDPESCGAARKSGDEALTGETCGPGIQPRKTTSSGRRRCRSRRKATSDAPDIARRYLSPARSQTPSTHGKHSHGNREILSFLAQRKDALGRIGKSQDVR